MQKRMNGSFYEDGLAESNPMPSLTTLNVVGNEEYSDGLKRAFEHEGKTCGRWPLEMAVWNHASSCQSPSRG